MCILITLYGRGGLRTIPHPFQNNAYINRLFLNWEQKESNKRYYAEDDAQAGNDLLGDWSWVNGLSGWTSVIQEQLASCTVCLAERTSDSLSDQVTDLCSSSHPASHSAANHTLDTIKVCQENTLTKGYTLSCLCATRQEATMAQLGNMQNKKTFYTEAGEI